MAASIRSRHYLPETTQADAEEIRDRGDAEDGAV